MEDASSSGQLEAPPGTGRKAWEEPAIVLERSLEAAAEGSPPAAAGRPGCARRVPGAAGPLAEPQRRVPDLRRDWDREDTQSARVKEKDSEPLALSERFS